MTDWKEISAQQANEKINTEEVIVIDIRDADSYEGGHIPDAIQLTDTNAKGFFAEADKDKPVIIYCYHGISSQGAASYLAGQGFKEVYSMAGGFESWRFTFPCEP